LIHPNNHGLCEQPPREGKFEIKKEVVFVVLRNKKGKHVNSQAKIIARGNPNKQSVVANDIYSHGSQ